MLGRSVLITGANRGLGLEFVKQIIALPEPPEFLFATCRSLSSADELKKLHSASGKTKLEILELDVCNDAQIAQVASKVKAVLGGKGGLNVLINNAGMLRDKESAGISAQTSKDLLDHFHANSVAPLIIAKELLPLLKEAASAKTRSTIVNITSLLGSIAENKSSMYPYPYRASKAALNMISKSMSIDLAPDGIVVVPLHPGWVRTDMGGPSAMIDPPESVAGMLKVIMKAGVAESGQFLTYDGGHLPW